MCVFKLGACTSTVLRRNLSIALNTFLNNAPEFSNATTRYFNLYSKSGDINAFMYVFQYYFKFKLARV